MKQLLFFLTIALALSTPSLAAPSEKSQLGRASRYIDSAQRNMSQLAKKMDSGGPVTPVLAQSWEKKLAKVQTALAKSQRLLDSLPEALAAAQRQRWQEAQERLGGLRQRLSQVQAGAAAATNLATGTGGQKAVEDYRKLSQRFRDVSAWLGSVKEDPKMLPAYRQGVQAREALDAKYASVLGMRSRETFALTAAANEAYSAQQAVVSRIASAQRQFPQVILKDLTKAEEYAQDLQKNKAFSGWEASVGLHMRYARVRYNKLMAVADPATPGLSKLAQTLESSESKMAQTKERFRAQMIATNTIPDDAYRGGDAGSIKTAIRQLWSRKYPSDSVLEVRIADSSWSDFSGTDWVSSSRSWQDYNFDRMRGYVIVAGPKYNYKFSVLIVRQNLQGGKIDLFPNRPDNPEDDVAVLLPKT